MSAVVEERRPSRATAVVKRLVDILGAAAGLVFLSPLLLLVAGAIWFSMGAPVFFRQARPGLGGAPFELIKFRTMRLGEGADGARLTPLGRFLRQSSLDELPELWNVLKGEMSLVGPRPLLLDYLELYSKEQARRHEVRPGITGLAQINGRNLASWEEKFRLDVRYVDEQSLWLDLHILIRTFWSVLKREGISAPGEATAPRFRGGGGA